MTNKGHQSEHDFVGMIRNWHKAVDGRGIDEDTRSYFCQCLLRWLLSNLMPWLKNTDAKLDFRTMDVFRKIQTGHVRGLTRETVVGLLANLTSLEMRKKEYRYRNIGPEHPKVGTTDDVEGFIFPLYMKCLERYLL